MYSVYCTILPKFCHPSTHPPLIQRPPLQETTYGRNGRCLLGEFSFVLLQFLLRKILSAQGETLDTADSSRHASACYVPLCTGRDHVYTLQSMCTHYLSRAQYWLQILGQRLPNCFCQQKAVCDAVTSPFYSLKMIVYALALRRK